jgi:hypothetical protein
MICRGSAYASSNGEFNSTKFLKHPCFFKEKDNGSIHRTNTALVNYPYESPEDGRLRN